jgi:hypothetical protein
VLNRLLDQKLVTVRVRDRFGPEEWGLRIRVRPDAVQEEHRREMLR